MKKIEIDKDELYQYYLVENHNQEETAKYFGIGKTTFKRILKEYGFKKTKEDILLLREKTNRERYGTYPIGHTPEMEEKKKKTCLKEYGVGHPMQSSTIQKKQQKTIKEKYGTEYYFQSLDFKEKSKKTCQERYQVDNPMQSFEIQKKRRETMMERYGVEYSAQSPNVLTNLLETIGEKDSFSKEKGIMYGIIEVFLSEVGVSGTTLKNFARNMGIHPTTAGRQVTRHLEFKKYIKYHSSISEPQHEVYKFIKENYDGKVIEGDRKVIAPKEIDILMPDLKLGIEFNGLYHHRTMRVPKSTRHKDKYYHQNKTLAALEKGYRLIHITDDEWRDSQDSVKAILLKELDFRKRGDAKLPYKYEVGKPFYYYTDSYKKWRRDDPSVPKALARIFELGLDDDEEWAAAEKAGYYRYYDDGVQFIKENTN